MTLESLIRWWKPRAVFSTGLIVLTMALFFPFRLDAARVEVVLRNGYGGRESGQVQAMEWLAAQAEENPGRQFVISVSRYGDLTDPTRAWGWLEFGLQYVFRPPNASVSGVSPQDDFRVVEFLDTDQDHHPAGCPWEGYDLVWESRRYAICQRRT